MKPVKVITYGRSSQNEKSFPTDPKMSRVHCQIIKYDNGMYQIIDFGSANGTWVNGRCIQKSVPQTLQSTDVVRIGETTLRWMDDFTGGGSNGGSHSGGGNYGGGNYDPGNYSNGGFDNTGYGDNDSDVNDKNTDSNSIWVFIMGLVSIGIIAYLIIGYFTSFGSRLLGEFGQSSDVLKGFVIYLHGWFGIGGQWFPIIAAIVIGGLADLVASLGDEEGGLKTAGLWMANAAVSIGIIFLLLAIFAEQIVS